MSRKEIRIAGKLNIGEIRRSDDVAKRQASLLPVTDGNTPPIAAPSGTQETGDREGWKPFCEGFFYCFPKLRKTTTQDIPELPHVPSTSSPQDLPQQGGMQDTGSTKTRFSSDTKTYDEEQQRCIEIIHQIHPTLDEKALYYQKFEEFISRVKDRYPVRARPLCEIWIKEFSHVGPHEQNRLRMKMEQALLDKLDDEVMKQSIKAQGSGSATAFYNRPEEVPQHIKDWKSELTTQMERIHTSYQRIEQLNTPRNMEYDNRKSNLFYRSLFILSDGSSSKPIDIENERPEKQWEAIRGMINRRITGTTDIPERATTIRRLEDTVAEIESLQQEIINRESGKARS